MKKSILLTVVMILMFNTAALAQKVSLKHTFFGGWRYSTDGLHYDKVGWSGKSLRALMEGNEEAQKHMDIYKSRMLLSRATSIPASLMIGWVLGAALFGDWESTHEVFILVSIPLAVTSLISESSAVSHLKKAVSIHNGVQQALMLDLGIKKSAANDSQRLTLSLNYRF